MLGRKLKGEGQKAYPSNGHPQDGSPWDKDQIKIVSARRELPLDSLFQLSPPAMYHTGIVYKGNVTDNTRQEPTGTNCPILHRLKEIVIANSNVS
jgi:hypothetical protein